MSEQCGLEAGTVNTWDPALGEGVDVPGHRFDVPDHELPLEVEDGRVLVESSMRADPVEGVQGHYTLACPEEECPECGTPTLHETHHTLAHHAFVSCPTCDWREDR